MGALLALVPTKDWFIGAAFAVLVVLGWHFYDKYKDAVAYAAQVKAESAVTLANAQKQITDFKAQYEANLKTVQDTYGSALAASNAHAAAADSRLREFDAYRASHPLPGSAGGSGSQSGADVWISRLVALEPVAAELAHGLEDARAQRDACVLERDSLTGK